MKLIKQLASIAILIFIFLIGYFHPDWFLGGGFTLCFLNYICEEKKRFNDNFTPPYLPDKPFQITSLPMIQLDVYDYSRKGIWEKLNERGYYSNKWKLMIYWQPEPIQDQDCPF